MLALLLGCVSKNIYPTKSMDAGQIIGSWFGSTPGDVHYYRLSLATNGTGIFGSVYWTNLPQVYQISSWKLWDDRITMTVRPLEEVYEPISIHADTVGQTIDLSVNGDTWQHRLTLRREDVFQDTIVRLRLAMDVKSGGN